MANLLERLFGRKKEEEKKPLSIGFHDVSSWLDEEERRIRTDLAHRTAESREIIDTALNDLKTATGHLATEVPAESTPVRLLKVADTARPAFLNALDLALSRHLSEDAEEYYAEIVELMRSAIRALKGQGKYLKAVYPESMKEIRSGISIIGDEINHLTEYMTPIQEKRKALAEIRDDFDAITARVREGEGMKRQWTSIWKKMEDDKEHLSALCHERLSLEADDDVKSWRTIQSKIETLNNDVTAISGEYQQMSAAIANTLRKAQYIAEKQQMEGTDTLSALVEECNRPDPDHLSVTMEQMTTVAPAIFEMVEKGDLPLKNKTEKELFAGEKKILEELGHIYAGYAATMEKIQDLKLDLPNNTKIRQLDEMDSKIRRIQERHDQDLGRIEEFERSFESLKKNCSSLLDTLSEKMQVYTENEVIINIDGVFIPELSQDTGDAETPDN